MKNLSIILFFILLGISYLVPIHYNPWLTFLSEILVFSSCVFLFLAFYKEKIILPRILIPLFLLSLLPLFQYFFGQVYFFSHAIINTTYLITLFLIIVVVFNIVNKSKCEKNYFFIKINWVFVVIGLVNTFLAIYQWLNLDFNTSLVTPLGGLRPFANFAQPNNMATFQIIAFLGLIYLYLKQKVNFYLFFILTITFIFSIALTQSRTAVVALISLSLVFIIFRKIAHTKVLVYYSFSVITYFILSIYLVDISSFIAKMFGLNIVNISSSVERGVSSSGRIDFWIQMYYAILERPWFGYGWNQTALAQYQNMEKYPIGVWITSSHNLLVDIIVWCGIPIGVSFILYFIYIIFSSILKIKKIEELFAFCMIVTLLVHSMLEYPLHYAYFLIPFGIFIAIILSANPSLKFYTFSFRYIAIYSFYLILGLFFVWKDYLLYIEENHRAIDHSLYNSNVKFKQKRELYILDELNFRLYWISLNPKQKLSEEEIEAIGKMVSLYLTHFDLYKYAKVLAYNRYSKEAKDQLKLIKQLYKVDRPYNNLLN
ncbi:O-antigen ligase C-terminal domain-containing protein [Acinetobacter indicus]|uniref:PglL family O-oligosaccharyltransferase n=1 Tax=Acinetobacter indicus TaxID=756892 RepID=UPI002576667D|nr:O-antigen ligase family protein [Acinetobacter indicus]MDM1338032.1 O-antigen ligase C-terminal domain-containing protein [Acinetobacter indicus]